MRQWSHATDEGDDARERAHLLRPPFIARLPLGPARAGVHVTTLQASLRAADRSVAPPPIRGVVAPLRRRDLARCREPCYRGPWRLPGPDFHRLAAVSLSLGYAAHLLSLWRPNCWTHGGCENSDSAPDQRFRGPAIWLRPGPDTCFANIVWATPEPMAHLRLAAGECIAAELWDRCRGRSALCSKCSAGWQPAASREVRQARPRVWRGRTEPERLAGQAVDRSKCTLHER
jgi:hypothetical protein